MTKDEILERSREDNKTRDEMEKNVFFKSGQSAAAVGGFIAALLIIVEEFITNKTNFGIAAILLSMTGTMLLTKYIKLKKKYYLIFSVLELAVAAAFIILHIIQLVG